MTVFIFAALVWATLTGVAIQNDTPLPPKEICNETERPY